MPGLVRDLAKQVPPPGHDVEIIFIDNNSSDNTSAVVKEAAGDCPYPVRVIREPQQGHSRARNTGWQAANGEFVLFLDDDVRLDPGFLSAYARGMDRYQPEGAGGPIEPFCDYPVPRWLDPASPLYAGYVVRVSLGSETRWLNETEFVWGANMAYSRKALQEVGGFDTNVGFIGARRLGGEETALQKKIRQHGGRILFIHDAGLLHEIPRHKLSLAFYLKQKYHGGIAGTRTRRSLPGMKDTSRRYKVRCVLENGLKSCGLILRRKWPQAVSHLGESAEYCGEWMEATFDRGGKPGSA